MDNGSDWRHLCAVSKTPFSNTPGRQRTQRIPTANGRTQCVVEETSVFPHRETPLGTFRQSFTFFVVLPARLLIAAVTRDNESIVVVSDIGWHWHMSTKHTSLHACCLFSLPCGIPVFNARTSRLRSTPIASDWPPE